MRRILKNKQLYIIFLISIIMAAYYGYNIRLDFLNLYVTYLANISIRYFFIILSVIIISIVYITNYNSSIIMRFKTRKKYLFSTIVVEFIIAIITIVIFNLIIILLNYPTCFSNITDILISILNFLIIFITISIIIKLIDGFINNHSFSCCVFLLIFASLDSIIEHFNFFFINKPIIDLNSIYLINYNFDYGWLYFVVIILIDFIMYVVINKIIIKKDFILKRDDCNE